MTIPFKKGLRKITLDKWITSLVHTELGEAYYHYEETSGSKITKENKIIIIQAKIEREIIKDKVNYLKELIKELDE